MTDETKKRLGLPADYDPTKRPMAYNPQFIMLDNDGNAVRWENDKWVRVGDQLVLAVASQIESQKATARPAHLS